MRDKVNYNDIKNSYNNRIQRGKPSDTFFNNLIPNVNEDEKEKWLNTDEAADYLSITQNALRILVHRARVKYFKLGSRLKFRKCDLLKVLQPQEAL